MLANTRPAPAEPEVDASRLGTLRTQIKTLERQQTNLVGELQTYQPLGDAEADQEWRAQLRRAFADLAAQRKAAQAELAALTTRRPADHDPADPTLLDAFPIIDSDLASLPEELERELYDSFHLQIRYHQPTRRATLRVTINGGTIDQLARTSQQISAHVPQPRRVEERALDAAAIADRDDSDSTGSAAQLEDFSHALCAPNGIRTRATALKGRRPRPLDDEGGGIPTADHRVCGR